MLPCDRNSLVFGQEISIQLDQACGSEKVEQISTFFGSFWTKLDQTTFSVRIRGSKSSPIQISGNQSVYCVFVLKYLLINSLSEMLTLYLPGRVWKIEHFREITFMCIVELTHFLIINFIQDWGPMERKFYFLSNKKILSALVHCWLSTAHFIVGRSKDD